MISSAPKSTDGSKRAMVEAQLPEGGEAHLRSGGEAHLRSVSEAKLVENVEVPLPRVDEPARWREQWWEAERAGAEPSDLAEGITQELWSIWRGVLDAAGVDRRWLAAVVGAYRRELWLWLVGERTWVQASSGLTGRVTRRLPPHELRHHVRCP